jgi:hypothetical protein
MALVYHTPAKDAIISNSRHDLFHHHQHQIHLFFDTHLLYHYFSSNHLDIFFLYSLLFDHIIISLQCLSLLFSLFLFRAVELVIITFINLISSCFLLFLFLTFLLIISSHALDLPLGISNRYFHLSNFLIQ